MNIMATTQLHDTSDPAQGLVFEALKRGEPLMFIDSKGDHGAGANSMNGAQTESERLATKDEPDLSQQPCVECGAMTQKEAETKCICAGDKDNCHGCELWPD
ncbi:MAG: hypothetical protein V4713_03965 [Pseudomonadota bacterium]